MDDKINITEKLQKIVKQRKTPLIIKKQETGYRPSRSNSGSLAGEGYSYSSEE